MTDDKDYYAILGVVPTAEAALIKAAYRRLSKLYHPDVYHGHDAKQKMSELNEAYDVLSDAGKRKRYDDARGDRSHSGAEFSSDSPTAESGADALEERWIAELLAKIKKHALTLLDISLGWIAGLLAKTKINARSLLGISLGWVAELLAKTKINARSALGISLGVVLLLGIAVLVPKGLERAKEKAAKGQAVIKEREAKEAELKDMVRRAEAGDRDAQIKLAEMYRWGSGVPQDHKEADRYYRMAADQQLADAQLAWDKIKRTNVIRPVPPHARPRPQFYYPDPWVPNDEHLNGSIDDLRIDNPALSEAEVKALYAFEKTWQITTVDRKGDVGKWTSISHGPAGHPAISYYDTTNKDLKYTFFNGTSWVATTVDSKGDVGHFTSLSHGPKGHPAISYRDATNQNLKFAAFDGARWVTTTVDRTGPPGGVGSWTSLSHGPKGYPAISYFQHTNKDLKFATFNGAGWVTTTVDRNRFVGIGSSLSYGPTGHPAISYFQRTKKDLKFATFNGARWVTTTVDRAGQPGSVGSWTSLSHGRAGLPAISYYDISNPTLKYAVFNGTSWVTKTVDSKGNVGNYTSLSHGPSGHPVISYRDETNQDLKYAAFDGAKWQIETVDSKGNVGYYTSLGHGPGGEVVIAYYDETNGDLKIAIKRHVD
jgi:hypothetical protein